MIATRRQSPGRRALTALLLATFLLGSLLTACASPPARAGGVEESATPTASPTGSPLAAGGLQNPRKPAAVLSEVDPAGIRIPRIGVTSTLESLGIDGEGKLDAPRDFDLAGWYAGGVVPGAVGPAIIAGHVDSPTAPAVFARLGELAPGDEVVITRTDGVELTFRVTGSAQSAKSAFPTDDVYSPVPAPELRLITCAGAFDSAVGHYTDNLVVFAVLEE
ncbi:class F sortase [Microbacterium pumilum]|uniref:Class F sortase n=1 Tax=Microbacterium pumilum TaxID=344165 RepID=A0ABN2SRM2_9MICO